MGEYAEAQWQFEMRRGRRDPIKPLPKGRNPVVAVCPLCGKGLREFRGQIWDSISQHYKKKHKGETVPDMFDPSNWETLTPGYRS